MLAFCTFLIALGFYGFYICSKKALVASLPLRVLAKNNTFIFRVMSSSLLLIAFVLYMVKTGIGVGFFLGLVALMAIGSMMVLLSPLPWRAGR